MTLRRKGLYLLLIVPLYHVLSILASLLATLLLPPDIFLQLALVVPLYALAIWWAVPAFQRVMGVEFAPHLLVRAKIFALASGLTAFALMIAAVFSGFATPPEALVLGAITLIGLHALILRRA